MFQPINWTSLVVLVIAGGGIVLYVQKLRKEKEEGTRMMIDENFIEE